MYKKYKNALQTIKLTTSDKLNKDRSRKIVCLIP